MTNCAVCGTPYTPKSLRKNGIALCCSRKCAGSRQKRYVVSAAYPVYDRVCLVCEKPFETLHSRKNTCSLECTKARHGARVHLRRNHELAEFPEDLVNSIVYLRKIKSELAK